MHECTEIIALLLPERPLGDAPAALPQRLVRRADGAVALETVASREEFMQAARVTGCFRRGDAIFDPGSRQVIGYEMVEVSP